VLDGAKTPELFPEWFIWELTFQSLPSSQTTRKIPPHVELGVTEAELKVLQNEVRAFKELQRNLGEKLRATRNAAVSRGKSEDQIRDATHVVNVEYRLQVLDARQRIYEQLSPESLIRLRTWIEQLIRGTQVHLRGRAVQLFREPR
jgi:hypothetical protein